jgi:hypothetical protein
MQLAVTVLARAGHRDGLATALATAEVGSLHSSDGSLPEKRVEEYSGTADSRSAPVPAAGGFWGARVACLTVGYPVARDLGGPDSGIAHTGAGSGRPRSRVVDSAATLAAGQVKDLVDPGWVAVAHSATLLESLPEVWASGAATTRFAVAVAVAVAVAAAAAADIRVRADSAFPRRIRSWIDVSSLPSACGGSPDWPGALEQHLDIAGIHSWDVVAVPGSGAAGAR